MFHASRGSCSSCFLQAIIASARASVVALFDGRPLQRSCTPCLASARFSRAPEHIETMLSKRPPNILFCAHTSFCFLSLPLEPPPKVRTMPLGPFFTAADILVATAHPCQFIFPRDCRNRVNLRQLEPARITSRMFLLLWSMVVQLVQSPPWPPSVSAAVQACHLPDCESPWTRSCVGRTNCVTSWRPLYSRT